MPIPMPIKRIILLPVSCFFIVVEDLIRTPQVGQISAFSNSNGFPQVGQNFGIFIKKGYYENKCSYFNF